MTPDPCSPVLLYSCTPVFPGCPDTCPHVLGHRLLHGRHTGTHDTNTGTPHYTQRHHTKLYTGTPQHTIHRDTTTHCTKQPGYFRAYLAIPFQKKTILLVHHTTYQETTLPTRTPHYLPGHHTTYQDTTIYTRTPNYWQDTKLPTRTPQYLPGRNNTCQDTTLSNRISHYLNRHHTTYQDTKLHIRRPHYLLGQQTTYQDTTLFFRTQNYLLRQSEASWLKPKNLSWAGLSWLGDKVKIRISSGSEKIGDLQGKLGWGSGEVEIWSLTQLHKFESNWI